MVPGKENLRRRSERFDVVEDNRKKELKEKISRAQMLEALLHVMPHTMAYSM